MMSNSVCPSCGQSLIAGGRFCGHCGAPVSFQPASPNLAGQASARNIPFRATQYVIEQKILAIRDTYGIKDTSGNLLAYVKQQLMSFGPRFWYEAPDGSRLGEIHGKILTIRPTFEIYDGQGQLRAVVKKKLVNLIGENWWMENDSGQEIAKVHGNIWEHDYNVQAPDGGHIAQIHKKWVSVRDFYCVEVQNPSFDPYLVLSYAISLDHSEKKENHSGLGVRI